MKEKMNKFLRKIRDKENLKKVLPVVLVIILLIMVTGITYAIATYTRTGGINTITTGNISMSFTESTNVISLKNELPKSDIEGVGQEKYFDFSVTSNLTTEVNHNIYYEISIEPLTASLETLSMYKAVENPSEEATETCETYLIEEFGMNKEFLYEICSGGKSVDGFSMQDLIDDNILSSGQLKYLTEIGVVELPDNELIKMDRFKKYVVTDNITSEMTEACETYLIDDIGWWSADNIGEYCIGGKDTYGDTIQDYIDNDSYDYDQLTYLTETIGIIEKKENYSNNELAFKVTENITEPMKKACETYLIEEFGMNKELLYEICSGGEDVDGFSIQDLIDYNYLYDYQLTYLTETIGIIDSNNITTDEGYEALSNSKIKIYLENKDTNNVLIDSILISDLNTSSYDKKSLTLHSATNTHSSEVESITTNYRLRAWIDYDVDSSTWNNTNKFEYKFRINVNSYSKHVEAVKSTPEYCFSTEPKIEEKSNIIDSKDYSYGMRSLSTIKPLTTGTGIYDYYCYEGNSYGYETITDVVIPDSVTSIEVGAFSEKNLTSITIPDSVTTIGAHAFSSNNLTSVVIPDSVTTIRNWAFESNNLTSVVIPDSVTSIGSQAFNYNNLTSIIVDSNNKKYDSRNNSNAIIETATNKLLLGCKNTIIPNSVTSIGEYAFYSNNLKSIEIPDSVTTIGNYAFNSSNLKSIEIPDSVTTIGESAFSDNNLTSIEIPNSVTYIGKLAFAHNNLTSVVIPDSVTYIGSRAFESTNLTSVTIGNSVQTIETEAFYNNNLTSVVIPDSVTTIGYMAFYNNNLTSVKIKGKSSSSGFATYGMSIWGWAPDYTDANITWNYTE